MGAPKKADWREERRKRAWELKAQDWQQKDIAAALGVSQGAVSHWLKRGREAGVEALAAHPPKGVAPRLSVEQKAQNQGLLARGAEAYGFRGDLWPDPAHLGWLTDPPSARDQGLSQAGSSQTFASGATSRLCT